MNKKFTLRNSGEYMTTILIKKHISIYEISLILLIENIEIEKISQIEIISICRKFLENNNIKDYYDNIELTPLQIKTFSLKVRNKLNVPEDK